jgi:hypothetical protein
MTTMNTFNICNKNINNLFDTLENRISYIEEILNKIKHIEFNYYKILAINEELKNDNKEFKKIIDIQNIKITKLENEITKLENDNKELKNENKELKNKINQLEDDKFKNKIFEAITDIINCDSLDTKITNCDNINNDLIKIKTVRNSNSHYIKNIDSLDVKNKKKQKILIILKSLSNEYKKELIYDYDLNNNEEIYSK